MPKEQPSENNKEEAACIKKQRKLYVSSLQVIRCQNFLSAWASVEGIFLLLESKRSCRFHVHMSNIFKTKLAASNLWFLLLWAFRIEGITWKEGCCLSPLKRDFSNLLTPTVLTVETFLQLWEKYRALAQYLRGNRYTASLQVSLQQRPVLIQIVSPEGFKIEYDHIQDKRVEGRKGREGK